MPDSGCQNEEDDVYLNITNSANGKKWLSRVVDDRDSEGLAQSLAVPEILARILVGRNIFRENVATFLNPKLRDHLPNPSDFKDMDKATERLADAITGGEVVAVLGDYDVDGATSSALLRSYFQQMNTYMSHPLMFAQLII